MILKLEPKFHFHCHWNSYFSQTFNSHSLTTCMKILIVDDNDSINKALSRFLEFNGYSCELLSEPQNAVDKIIHGSYDLVILDLAMPKVSGYDIIEQLHKSAKISNTKILINTASTLDDANREKLFQSGVKGFNLKTNDPEILLAKIKEIINN